MIFKRTVWFALALAAIACAQSAEKDAAAMAPEIPFKSEPDFLKLPEGLYLGEAAGVATNKAGRVFVFTRSRTSRLFEFDVNGAFVREIGKDLYGFAFAHAVRVDAQDNIWTVDEGTNVIVKFNSAGRVAMVLGRRPEPFDLPFPVPYPQAPIPAAHPYVFNRPTDVTWDAASNIFVSDGYGNSRVVKYDKDGRFLKSIGEHGSENGQFIEPHTIASDAQGNIYIGDRGNKRIQVFDNDLNFRYIISGIGSPFSVCISPGPHQYLYSGNSSSTKNPRATGEIYKMELDGRIIGKFGRGGTALKEFEAIHAIDCRVPNELLIGEVNNWRVQKLKLQAQPASGEK
jgi:hypothetical protein